MKNNLLKEINTLLILSLILVFGCKKKNNQPDIPEIPAGRSNGYTDQKFTFTSSTTDPDGDSIAICFDWGDGDSLDWSLFVPSGYSVSMTHSWSSQGTYFIKAKAKDMKDAISSWSSSHQIEITIPIIWTKTYGGSGADCGYSVQQTLDGGYIIAGYTHSFGAGGSDVYLIKTDGNGDIIWTKTYGGSNDDGGNSVQQTSDAGYIIAGWTHGGIYLIKTDGNGDTVWTKTFGGSSEDEGYSVQQTSDGGYIIAGYTKSFGAGLSDVYLIKTDGNGDTVWTKTFGGSSEDEGYSVQLTSDGGYTIAGYTYSFSAGKSDVYLIKTDANGNIVWTKTFGGGSYDVGYSVQKTSDRGFIITGYTSSFGCVGQNVYLIKTDGNNDTIWTKTFSGSGYDVGYSVQKTSDRGFIITGYFSANGGDVYLIKTDANGNTLNNK
jgi:hypothetical protein